MKPIISLQEKFRLIAEKLNTLPMGYGYSINYSTDGTSVPRVKVEIEKGYDNFLHTPTYALGQFTAEEYDNEEFESCYNLVCRTVERIQTQVRSAIKETTTSNEDNPF